MHLPSLSKTLAAALAVSSPFPSRTRSPSDVCVGYGLPSASHAPPDPAFTFTLSCDSWRLEYLADGAGLSLWTSCFAQQPGASSTESLAPGTEIYVNGRILLDRSYVANAKSIKAAYPSNAAPVSFSSICHDCSLVGNGSSIMTCSCSTNGGAPRLAIDLGLNIAGTPEGLPCFTDGDVCAVAQSTTTRTIQPTRPTKAAP